MQQILVNITADGTVTVEAKCVKGAKCHDLTKALEAAIGTTVSDKRTPEYHQQEATNVQRAGH